MWEKEMETLQPREYLYPPAAPRFTPPDERQPSKPPASRGESKSGASARGSWQSGRPDSAAQTAPSAQTPPSAAPSAFADKQDAVPPRRQTAAARPAGKGETNYLLLAQLAVCLGVIAFVLLMQKTDQGFYEEMGRQYQAALEQGVELTGQGELLKFTEEAMARVQQAASQALDQVRQEGAGGWNPTSQTSQPPAGYSMEAYTLSQAPALPLESYTVTSAYGFRDHPITGEPDFHGGLDLAAPEGAPVLAVLEGVVLQTGTSDSYGNYVRVLHTDGLVSTYNHLSSYSVKPGQKLEKGQQLGQVGSTGVSTGPHLHLEFLLNGVRVNPAVALGIQA